MSLRRGSLAALVLVISESRGDRSADPRHPGQLPENGLQRRTNLVVINELTLVVTSTIAA